MLSALQETQTSAAAGSEIDQPSKPGHQLAVHCVRQDVGDAALNVALAQVGMSRPTEGEALVKMALRPINPADIRSVQGLFAGFHPETLPAVPGIEGMGHLESPCAGLEIGQRVVSTAWPLSTGQGTWQEYCVSPQDHLYPVPENVTDKQAASFWSNPVTAVGLLETAAVPKGQWLLQTAAHSNIGRQIIQIAKDYGIHTINIVRRDEQKEKLLQLGADVVVCPADEDLEGAVALSTHGKGVYACLDAVGGEQCETLLRNLRVGGTLIIYSGLSGPRLSACISDVVYGSKVIRGFRMTPWFMSHDSTGRKNIVQEVFRLLEHVIQANSSVVYPLEDIKKALQAAQNPAGEERILLSSQSHMPRS